MTPQERAAAIHAKLVLATTREAKEDNLLMLEQAVKETRRAALRDVLSDLDSLHWKEHWYADQLRKKINDRLASEGG